MKLSKEQIDILEGKICPYCKSTKLKIKPLESFKQFTSYQYSIQCENHPQCFSMTAYDHILSKPIGRLSNAKIWQLRSKITPKYNEIVLGGHMTEIEISDAMVEYLNVPKEYSHYYYFNYKSLDRMYSWCIRKLLHFNYDPTKPFTIPIVGRKRCIIIESYPYDVLVEFDDESRKRVNRNALRYYKPKK